MERSVSQSGNGHGWVKVPCTAICHEARHGPGAHWTSCSAFGKTGYCSLSVMTERAPGQRRPAIGRYTCSPPVYESCSICGAFLPSPVKFLALFLDEISSALTNICGTVVTTDTSYLHIGLALALVGLILATFQAHTVSQISSIPCDNTWVSAR